MIWFLACLGVLYVTIDIFGEGGTSATIAGIGALLVTMYMAKKGTLK